MTYTTGRFAFCPTVHAERFEDSGPMCKATSVMNWHSDRYIAMRVGVGCKTCLRMIQAKKVRTQGKTL